VIKKLIKSEDEIYTLGLSLAEGIEDEVAERLKFQRHYKYLFDTSIFAIIIIGQEKDEQEPTIEINDEAINLFGFTKEEFPSVAPQELVVLEPDMSFGELRKNF